MYDGIHKRLEDYLERPLDPLNEEQAKNLMRLNADKRFRLHANKRSMEKGISPEAIYVFLNDEFIGVAYGSRFELFENLGGRTSSPEIVNVARRIEDIAYSKR